MRAFYPKLGIFLLLLVSACGVNHDIDTEDADFSIEGKTQHKFGPDFEICWATAGEKGSGSALYPHKEDKLKCINDLMTVYIRTKDEQCSGKSPDLEGSSSLF